MQLRRHPYRGRLITFCGVDGSGKSTLLRMAADYISRSGRIVYETRMPTKAARESPLLQQFMYDPDPARRADIDFLAVSLLVMADRLQHLKEAVIPRLRDGEFVLCDRYVFQALAFSAAMDEPDRELMAIAERFPRPDLAVFMDVPVSLAVSRIKKRGKDRDRFLDVAGLARQAQAYREIGRKAGGLLLSSDRSESTTFMELRPSIDAILQA